MKNQGAMWTGGVAVMLMAWAALAGEVTADRLSDELAPAGNSNITMVIAQEMGRPDLVAVDTYEGATGPEGVRDKPRSAESGEDDHRATARRMMERRREELRDNERREDQRPARRQAEARPGEQRETQRRQTEARQRDALRGEIERLERARNELQRHLDELRETVGRETRRLAELKRSQPRRDEPRSAGPRTSRWPGLGSPPSPIMPGPPDAFGRSMGEGYGQGPMMRRGFGQGPMMGRGGGQGRMMGRRLGQCRMMGRGYGSMPPGRTPWTTKAAPQSRAMPWRPTGRGPMMQGSSRSAKPGLVPQSKARTPRPERRGSGAPDSKALVSSLYSDQVGRVARLLDSGLADRLRLTQDQRERLRRGLTEYRKQMAHMSQRVASAIGGIPLNERRSKLPELAGNARKRASEMARKLTGDSLEILTPRQREAVKKLLADQTGTDKRQKGRDRDDDDDDDD